MRDITFAIYKGIEYSAGIKEGGSIVLRSNNIYDESKGFFEKRIGYNRIYIKYVQRDEIEEIYDKRTFAIYKLERLKIGGKSMREVSIDGNILSIDHTKITVKYPIKQVESISEKYVVLLKIPRVELGKEELNNILCYDENGKMCWRISDELPSNIASKEQMPYVAIQIIDGILYATDFWGRKFNVDIENGKLIDFRIVR